jgi:CRAL/TRIO domain
MAAYEKSAKETNSKAQTDGKTSPKLLRLFALYENLIRFVMPLCTALTDRDHPRTPITQSNNIVDISGVGLKQFWNLRTHMQDASTLATAHYPETLDRIFVSPPNTHFPRPLLGGDVLIEKQIIGAPAFFPTVWGWIKRWFDPITTSKIFILSSHDLVPTLEAFIEPANIPKKYGGQLDFHFGDMPILDPAMEKVIQWEGERKDFPRGPMYWVNKSGETNGKGEGHNLEALAVGAEGGKERLEKVCKISTKYPDPVTEAAPVMNGHAVKPEYLSAPTEIDLPSTLHQAKSPHQESSKPENGKVEAEEGGEEKAVVQEGKLIPASRPEPVTFVTAAEGVETLNEKTENLALNGHAKGPVENGNGPHKTATANLLDPNVAPEVGKTGTEDSDEHPAASETSSGIVEKVKEKVEL